jgi:hypothetical protein
MIEASLLTYAQRASLAQVQHACMIAHVLCADVRDADPEKQRISSHTSLSTGISESTMCCIALYRIVLCCFALYSNQTQHLFD